MNKTVTFAFVCICAAAVACSAQTPTVAPPTVAVLTPTPRKSGTLRFSFNGPAEVQDVPHLMALDSLKAQGYTIEQTTFASNDLIPAALVRGDIDFASGDANIAWSAIAKGADIRTIAGRTNTSAFLIAKQTLQTCQDLNGRPIGFSGSTSVGTVMFQRYLKQSCPGISPQLVFISNSINRVAALQTGQVDGARLEMVDWVGLQRQAPGKFRVFLDFAKEFPQFKFASFSVRRAWAEQNQEAVKDFIRALLTAQRSVIGNPQLLRDEIVKYLSLDSASAQESADAYLAAGIWDPNGGLTPENLQEMMDFLASSGAVPQGMKVDDVANLSYLNAVLSEMGRK